MTLVTGQEDNNCSMEKIICQYAEKLLCRKKGRELRYRKIRKISPGAYIFLAKALFEGLTFGGGLYQERLIYGGKFAFQNRLGQLIVGRNFTVFSYYKFLFTVFLITNYNLQITITIFYFVFEDTVFKYKPPGAYIRRGHLTKRFLRYGFEGLIFEEAYFPNFTAWGGPKTGVWLFITDFTTRF